MTTFQKAERFIYRNARPLDLARWQYHFENGSAEAVWKALSAYQNVDGGFGHGLEADCLNPNSSPIQTWQATVILAETGLTDNAHPIVQGILRYLESDADFDPARNQWMNCVPTNNAYPHAIWWEYKEETVPFQYNPTAALAGFILQFADKNSALYSRGCAIAQQALDYFAAHVPFEESHITECFVELYQYCLTADIAFLDMQMFEEKLVQQIKANVCTDVKKWHTEYVTKPSQYISSVNSLCYAEFAELLTAECETIVAAQLADGSFSVPWQWYTSDKEFVLAENWLKSALIIQNMRTLKNFGAL